jgi:hypothetical protein
MHRPMQPCTFTASSQKSRYLDPTTLLWTATVMWNRRHIGNQIDPDSECSQCADRRFATWTGTLDFDIEVLDALLDSSPTSDFRRDLCCKRRRFARAFETLTTRGCPRQGIALTIGDRDDCVVEGGVHMSDAVRNVLANLLADALCGVVGRSFSHAVSILISSGTAQPCADPCGCGHWCACAGRASAGHGDGESRDNSRCPSIA